MKNLFFLNRASARSRGAPTQGDADADPAAQAELQGRNDARRRATSLDVHCGKQERACTLATLGADAHASAGGQSKATLAKWIEQESAEEIDSRTGVPSIAADPCSDGTDDTDAHVVPERNLRPRSGVQRRVPFRVGHLHANLRLHRHLLRVLREQRARRNNSHEQGRERGAFGELAHLARARHSASV